MMQLLTPLLATGTFLPLAPLFSSVVLGFLYTRLHRPLNNSLRMRAASESMVQRSFQLEPYPETLKCEHPVSDGLWQLNL